MKSIHPALLSFFLLLAPVCSLPVVAAANGAETEIHQALRNKLQHTELAALYNQQGKQLFFHQAGGDATPSDSAGFVPASIIKILTAWAAMEYLGADYRFATNIRIDPASNHLIIQGRGDPLLVSESITMMARQIRAAGYTNFAQLSFNARPAIAWQLPPGSENSTNPYDAPNGALVVNFNTMFLRLDGARVVSAESQTPTLPMAADFSHLLDTAPKRINLGLNRALSERYAHELFIALFEKEGVQIDNNNHSSSIKTEGAGAEPAAPDKTIQTMVFHNTRTLREVVRAMLTYSNNFIANQLGLVMLLEAAPELNQPAQLAEAVGLLSKRAYANLAISPNELKLAELSGLSRINRITPTAMQRILTAFAPHAGLMRQYNRQAGIADNQDVDIRAKSGTLEGLSNLAGYISTSNRSFRFIIHTSSNNNRDAILSLLVKLSLRYSS